MKKWLFIEIIGIYKCKTKKKEKFLIAFKIINEIG